MHEGPLLLLILVMSVRHQALQLSLFHQRKRERQEKLCQPRPLRATVLDRITVVVHIQTLPVYLPRTARLEGSVPERTHVSFASGLWSGTSLLVLMHEDCCWQQRFRKGSMSLSNSVVLLCEDCPGPGVHLYWLGSGERWWICGV